MKKALLILALLSSQTFAGWADSDFYEPTVGCVGGATAGFMNSTGDSASQIQTMAIGCAIGGLVGYFLNDYYGEKVGRQYRGNVDKLNSQLEAFRNQQAFDAANGIDRWSTIKKEVVPGQANPDGSIDLPSLRIRVHTPGAGMVLGD